MSDELSDADLTVWRTFLNAHATAVGRIEDDLTREGGLPLVDYDVLIALEHAPDNRLRLRDLNRRVVLTRSGVTRLVDRLEEAGLLRRERCVEDRRAIYAVLNDEGRNAIRRTWPIYASGIQRHFVRFLSPPYSSILTAELERVARQDPESAAPSPGATAGMYSI